LEGDRDAGEDFQATEEPGIEDYAQAGEREQLRWIGGIVRG
jgi:hypothetical protein